MAPIDHATAKAEKKAKKEKKRAREEEAGADTERKHKKSKSVVAAEVPATEPEKKKKKSKKDKHDDGAVKPLESEHAAVEEAKPEKKHKKKKHDAAPEETPAPVEGEKKKKKSKKSKDTEETDSSEPQKQTEEAAPADADAMDIDMPPPAKPSKSKDDVYQPPDIPTNPQFPFFTQTVSLYEPLFPIGWAQPVTNCQYQHLQHHLNKYVPSLRGVLLEYRNVAFGENPGRNGAATTDEEPATVMSKAEAAVGWGWITADVDLFVPSRGAWMEGSVNLQTEGHIGVVCFGKFNASIEARRLPPDWKWVPNESSEAQGFEETASVITADDHGVVRQIHSTGFWADGNGDKVKGKIRFRIRNFDVGTSGDISYLSLEGTMLDKAGEKAVVAEEAETARMRQGKKGGQRIRRRQIPEFAMTRFAVDEEQEQTEASDKEKLEALALPEDQ
ncbi:hypothetical protein LB507_009936 [Fusarium sp. FIESC RH6]|nr:hypothetical protein LB507_009936 [Fusarium sp. FIESC RH6]